jgi:hypothetical protein
MIENTLSKNNYSMKGCFKSPKAEKSSLIFMKRYRLDAGNTETPKLLSN